jgi:hypothetical protein
MELRHHDAAEWFLAIRECNLISYLMREGLRQLASGQIIRNFLAKGKGDVWRAQSCCWRQPKCWNGKI